MRNLIFGLIATVFLGTFTFGQMLTEKESKTIAEVHNVALGEFQKKYSKTDFKNIRDAKNVLDNILTSQYPDLFAKEKMAQYNFDEFYTNCLNSQNIEDLDVVQSEQKALKYLLSKNKISKEEYSLYIDLLENNYSEDIILKKIAAFQGSYPNQKSSILVFKEVFIASNNYWKQNTSSLATGKLSKESVLDAIGGAVGATLGLGTGGLCSIWFGCFGAILMSAFA